MIAASKTIGPMTRRRTFGVEYWFLNGSAWLCCEQTRRRLNLPKSAAYLWVNLTRQKPRHPDAFKLKLSDRYLYMVSLDSNPAIEFRLNAFQVLDSFLDSNDHCYATIYYE